MAAAFRRSSHPSAGAELVDDRELVLAKAQRIVPLGCGRLALTPGRFGVFVRELGVVVRLNRVTIFVVI